MKQDFSQPLLKQSETEVSLFVRLADGRYALSVIDRESLDREYVLPSFTVAAGDDLTLELLKYLYELGLSVVRYSSLRRERCVSFSLVDGTPGRTQESEVLIVHADMAKESPGLAYVSRDEMARTLCASSLVDDVERECLMLLPD